MDLKNPTKNDIEKLLASLKNAIDYWVCTMSPEGQRLNTSNQASSTTTRIQESHLSLPLEELIKLTSLVHARATKLGIVFKPPIIEENYHACYVELNEGVRNLILLVSLSKQLTVEEQKYSKLLVRDLLRSIKVLLTSYSGLLGELEQTLGVGGDNTSDESYRLVSVGKIWEACGGIQDNVHQGSSGLLKRRLKQTNQLIADALNEYEDWLANPVVENFDEGFGEVEDDEDDEEQDTEAEGKSPSETPGLESDAEVEVDSDLVALGKQWGSKIKMVRLLVSSLDKSIPSSKYTISFSKSIDLLDARMPKLSEAVDDVVASVIYDQDLDGAKEAGKTLIDGAMEVASLVKKMNMHSQTRIRWIDTWTKKFIE
ncbi:DEKNAAC100296 [Brettanomyces naardenensis]|uniref:DEKNAAC100296 n=1 Tax=Brettanomyces naardenensis TaxID=13370 RepID=A0A448YGC2_BRENA|nr:DEKNAAC100296 [Brettanomyces naardenensis]